MRLSSHQGFLLDAAETRTIPQNMKDAQEHLSETKAVDVTISDEGMDALREKISGFEVESDDIMASMISLGMFTDIINDNVNFVAKT